MYLNSMPRFWLSGTRLLATVYAFVLSITFSSFLVDAHAEEFTLHDNERIVFLGDGLIEQAQYSGWIEVGLTTAFPDQNLTFRNLGWSGDTPAGDSRFGLSLLQAGREPADEGWQQLKKQLELTAPTVLVLGYGTSSMLTGDDGLKTFVSQYDSLLAAAREISPQVRFVFLSPLAVFQATPDQDRRLQQYAGAIRKLAEQNDAPFVDLTQTALSGYLRKDPIHLNDDGYRAIAFEITNTLDLPSSNWQTSKHTEALRQTILRKNQWWFHRSRPANMAYVFGFRKHEQGQNAVEIPQFDSLIHNEEQRIASLSKLQAVELPEIEPKLESKYAEFTPQPIPEFSVPDDWEVTLWAQNPLLNKPIHMNFDPQGRLWVASSEAYPMIEVGQSAPDKVIVLEDSTGDGVADKSSVFAEGLLIPTGIAPGDGGVYVAQSTDLLLLKDLDGDGKADLKTRVLSGFGTEDTHHNLHTLRWGPDGRLYMNQSVYTRTDAETPFGVVRLKAGGGFRYDTRSMRMEIFFRGLWNSWGHQFDEFGQSFLTDGAGFQGVAYAFPGATFNPAPQSRYQLGLISPGNWPKFASLEILGGDAFPEDWQGSIVTCDFRANRVTRFSLTEQDSGFVTTQEADLLRTSAPTFRPIDVKLGPDGALYIADWSNPIINHGEVDFRDSRRDRWHGRIWRLKWKGASEQPKVDFTELTTAELFAAITGEDRYAREQARRILFESPADTAAHLETWLAKQTSPQARLEGLWLHQGTDVANIALLEELLAADDHRIRAAATRVLRGWADPAAQPATFIDSARALGLLERLIQDEHPRVRLEAVRALAILGTAEAGMTALRAVDAPMDRFLQHALALTIDELATPVMSAVEQGSLSAEATNHAKQLDFVLTSIEPGLASRFLSKRIANGKIEEQGPWIELIGKAGSSNELEQLFAQLLDGGFSPSGTVRGLEALSLAQRLRKMRPKQNLQRIGDLVNAEDEAVQVAAIQLAGTWKLRNQSPSIAALASSASASMGIRRVCVASLRQIGGPAATDTLSSLATQAKDADLRQDAVVALASLNANQSVEPFFQVLAKTRTENEAVALWRGMLGTKGVGKALAKDVASQQLPDYALTAGMRAVLDGGRNEPELREAITPLAGSMKSVAFTPERARQLVQLVPHGDAMSGELIYRRTELACATCHAIGGVGGKVGPDMTSLGASAPVDYIVEALFDPNAKIKEGFHSVQVVTEDDRVLSGVEVQSTAEELVLRDATNQLVRIPQADILAKKTGKSLMPTGVVDRLSESEQVDLIRFLSLLGKPGAFDASQGGVARRFEIFAGTHRIEQQGAERIIQGEIKDGWKPLLTFVSGDVPAEALRELTKQPINIALVHVYARTRIETSSSADVSLTIPAHGALWIDGIEAPGRRTKSKTTFQTHVAAGKHEVLVRLDARDLPETFRLESKDVAFLGE